MIMGAISDLSWDTEGGPMTIKQRGTREMLTALEMGDQSEVEKHRERDIYSDFIDICLLFLFFCLIYSFIIVVMIYILKKVKK
jgi:hypothetical protein